MKPFSFYTSHIALVLVLSTVCPAIAKPRVNSESIKKTMEIATGLITLGLNIQQARVEWSKNSGIRTLRVQAWRARKPAFYDLKFRCPSRNNVFDDFIRDNEKFIQNNRVTQRQVLNTARNVCMQQ